MSDYWSKPIKECNPTGLDYWEYFGVKLAERAAIAPGAKILDIGCGTGSSLIPSGKRAEPTGYATGIDICPG